VEVPALTFSELIRNASPRRITFRPGQPPNDRARLEQLCPYLLRPPLAQNSVRLRGDGRVLVELKTVWHDGTSHLLFEPIKFLEKLAAIIPRPAVNLVLYHGVLAPHARWRSHVVSYDRPAPASNAPEIEASPHVGTPGAWSWAALMRRVFDLDVLACPRCGGRLRVIATVQDSAVVRTILAHLGRAHSTEPPGPAPPPPPSCSPPALIGRRPPPRPHGRSLTGRPGGSSILGSQRAIAGQTCDALPHWTGAGGRGGLARGAQDGWPPPARGTDSGERAFVLTMRRRYVLAETTMITYHAARRK
jgi:Putative transposase